MVVFTHHLRVRYGECDSQKVVYNPRYAEYVDIAVLEFLRSLPMGANFFKGDLDYQLVKQTTEWKASACFDDALAITVQPLKTGTTSFTLRADIRINGSEKVIVSAEMVYVLMKAVELSKLELPEALRAALAR